MKPEKDHEAEHEDHHWTNRLSPQDFWGAQARRRGEPVTRGAAPGPGSADEGFLATREAARVQERRGGAPPFGVYDENGGAAGLIRHDLSAVQRLDANSVSGRTVCAAPAGRSGGSTAAGMSEVPVDDRLFPARPILAVSVAVFRDGLVLLGRRTRPPMAGRFSLPGGVVEVGETLGPSGGARTLRRSGRRGGDHRLQPSRRADCAAKAIAFGRIS